MLRKNPCLFNTPLSRSNEPMQDNIELQKKLRALGIQLDIETGHLFYSEHFQPLSIHFNLIFVRHGETYGNCGQTTATGQIDLELVRSGIKDKEKCIYQGDVDTDINQLTEHGKQQALAVAEKLSSDFITKGWEPDLIFVSPLSRAKDTALPFVQKHQFEDRYVVHDGIKEMSFGSWDNRRLCDLPTEDVCHLFYRDQHALVKNSGINGNNSHQEAESFSELLLRARNVLLDINEKHYHKNILMFSHSMFGAACSILLGKGQRVEHDTYLAFDGKRKDNTSYIMPNATPIILNMAHFGPKKTFS